MSDEFDLAHDKLPDQPVTVGGDKSAAAWHPNSGSDVTHANFSARLVAVTLRAEAAEFERDALAHVIEQAPHAKSCSLVSSAWHSSASRCTCWKYTAARAAAIRAEAE